jgi:hypothetical protein
MEQHQQRKRIQAVDRASPDGVLRSSLCALSKERAAVLIFETYCRLNGARPLGTYGLDLEPT